MGCKQHLACDNNMKRNFVESEDIKQCKPGDTSGKSVCRQCCDGSPDCALNLAALNVGLGPLTEEEWSADLAEHEPEFKIWKIEIFCKHQNCKIETFLLEFRQNYDFMICEENFDCRRFNFG